MIPADRWHLTLAETDAIDALIETGSRKLAAEKLGKAVRTIDIQITHILDKAGTDSTLLVALAWDRYSRKVPA